LFPEFKPGVNFRKKHHGPSIPIDMILSDPPHVPNFKPFLLFDFRIPGPLEEKISVSFIYFLALRRLVRLKTRDLIPVKRQLSLPIVSESPYSYNCENLDITGLGALAVVPIFNIHFGRSPVV